MPGFLAIISRFLGWGGNILRGERPFSSSQDPTMFNIPNKPHIGSRHNDVHVVRYMSGTGAGREATLPRKGREAYTGKCTPTMVLGGHIQGYPTFSLGSERLKPA